MSPRILDEHSLKAREQDIIDATIVLIEKHGVENITMDKVVAAVPYSKGTVYKHFIGKEDLFLAIGNHATTILSDLFSRAAHHKGCARERMMLKNISYLIYAILHPSLFKTVQCAKSPSVYGKSSEKRIREQDSLEQKLMGTIFGLIEDAQANQQLELPKHMDVMQVCFNIWAANYGVIQLLYSDSEMCGGIPMVVERELFNQNNLIFDGLGWEPLTHDKDYKLALESALKLVFPGELALMKSMGRELNFS